jgi:uncharacterized protein YodC (DUF2158 family)
MIDPTVDSWYGPLRRETMPAFQYPVFFASGCRSRICRMTFFAKSNQRRRRLASQLADNGFYFDCSPTSMHQARANACRPRKFRHDSKKEFKMLTFTKRSSIAIAATLGIALSTSLSFAARADTDAPKPATQSFAAARLRIGDLVRVRSGGPLLTVTSVQGDQVNCSWFDQDGRVESQNFPIWTLKLPVVMPRTDWGAARDPAVAADQN